MYYTNNNNVESSYIIRRQRQQSEISMTTERSERILDRVIQNLHDTRQKIACKKQLNELSNKGKEYDRRGGITVVNMYSKCRGGSSKELRNSRSHRVDELNVEMGPRNEEKKKKEKIANCYVTDEEREEEKRIENPLPYWHISEAASNMKHKAIRRNLNCGERRDLNDYMEMRTAKEREEQFNGKYRQTRKHVKMESGPGYHRMHAISSETLVEPLPEPPRREIELVKRYQRNTQICDRIHECRPFYGTVETERACSAAIDHIINLQKELNKLQFTTGCILPQSQQFIDSVDSIHIALKQFNNHFRRLKDASDDILGQKTGIQLTVTMDKSGKGEDVQFPVGGLSERQKSRK